MSRTGEALLDNEQQSVIGHFIQQPQAIIIMHAEDHTGERDCRCVECAPTDNPALDKLVELGVIAQENVAEFMKVAFVNDEGNPAIYNVYPDGPPEWLIEIMNKCGDIKYSRLLEQAMRTGGRGQMCCECGGPLDRADTSGDVPF